MDWVGLILPVVVCVALAVALPLWLARRLPDSYAGLGMNFGLSALALLVISMVYFASFRPWGVVKQITQAGEYYTFVFWDVLISGLMSAMIWGPIVVLVLVMQPQKWRPDL